MACCAGKLVGPGAGQRRGAALDRGSSSTWPKEEEGEGKRKEGKRKRRKEKKRKENREKERKMK
jgi:hypothetical protein